MHFDMDSSDFKAMGYALIGIVALVAIYAAYLASNK